MKNLKRIFSIVISLTMVFSLFGAFSAQAAETEYNFYTQVGASFTPVTEGVTWNNTDTIDTSVMGRQVIYGTKDGATVKGIINVGTQKWNSYQNNEGKTAGTTIGVSSTNTKDEWRYMSTSDGEELATYVQDPKNSNNVVVKYMGGANISASNTNKITNYNQIQYYPTTQNALGNSYSVEFRFMADGAAINGDTYEFQFRNANKSYSSDGKTSLFDSFILKRVESGLSIALTGTEKDNSYTKNPPVDAWLDIKYVVYYDENNTVRSSIYLNGERVLDTTSKNVTTAEETNKIIPMEYLYIKNSAGIAKANYTEAVRFAGYIDDVKITDLGLATKEYIYYDSFEDEYNYEYLQADGTQEMSINETVKFVTNAGADSGYSTEIYASAVADTSKLGTFKSTTALPGFDEPLAISWTVYKEQLAWQETFENYTETDIGKTPSLSPWIAGTSGKTIEYENAEAEVKNIVLKYTASGRDNDWLKMGNNKSIDGKFSIEWSFMLPELVANTDCKFQVMAGTAALIETNIGVNDDEQARLGFADRTANIYPLQYGELKANTWYTVKFNIDTIADTFTYSVGDINDTTVRTIKAESTGAFDQFRFAQRGENTGNLKIYVDDVKVNKVLTIQSPVAQNITVYKGDVAVLPETATVLLTDGETTDEAEVTWNGTIDTSAVGTKTITGSVTGTSTPATLNVEVSAFPYEIVSANLKNGSTEVFGLIKGGALSSATLNKIANDTKAGRVYAAVYDADKKLIGANVVSIDTSSAWSKETHKDIAITLNLPNSNDIDIDTCTLKLFVLSDSLVPFASVKAQSNTDAQAATTVWIAGDSLAQKTSTRPQTGWGEAFETLCENEGINVENRALGGRSSKSFYDQELLKDILAEAEAGDYLFVQFGHNDSKSYDATRYTTYDEGGTFEQYMTKYITEARAKGVIPVILTPVVRATWPKLNGVTNGGTEFNGATYSNLDKYAAAAKRVAAKYHVPMIDIHALTEAYFTALSGDDGEWTDSEKAEVWKYFDYYADTTTLEPGNADTTHLNEAGAELVTNMIKEEMEKIRLPLYKLFK